MSKLMDKMLKSTKIKESSMLGDSRLFLEKEVIQTSIPALNIALSGDLDGGLRPGLTSIAGPSRHFKTSYALLMASAYIKKHPDGVILFYNSEFGAGLDTFEAFGIPISNVIHLPITTIEELMSDLSNKLDNKNEDGIKRGDKVLILVDSVGNLASLREADNAMSDDIKADVGQRQKILKSFYRIITPHLTMKNIPMVAIQHCYQTMEMFSKTVMSGGCLKKGTKIMLSDNSCKEIENILVGELVKTLDGDKEVTHTWNPDTLFDGTPECYKITFEDGYSVICSDKHKFLIGDDWVEAKHLEENSQVILLE